MSITAKEIQEVVFNQAKKNGYDTDEVDEFLERVAADVDMLTRALTEAATRIKTAEKRAEEAEKRVAMLEAAPPPPPAPVIEAAPVVEAVDTAITGEVIAKAFIAAQRSADALQEEARKEAERIYREAESKGRDIVRDALSEKQKALDELARLRMACERFRTEYLALLRNCESDAQKRLSNFDEVLQAQQTSQAAQPAQSLQAAQAPQPSHSAAETKVVSPGVSVSTDSGYSVEIGDREARSRKSDPFAPPSYRSRLNVDDDLDIEEID